jgi:hypothetical protein
VGSRCANRALFIDHQSVAIRYAHDPEFQKVSERSLKLGLWHACIVGELCHCNTAASFDSPEDPNDRLATKTPFGAEVCQPGAAKSIQHFVGRVIRQRE